jgi:hypothetical protein
MQESVDKHVHLQRLQTIVWRKLRLTSLTSFPFAGETVQRFQPVERDDAAPATP